MAVYTFTTIETSLIGDTGVILKEQNTQDGMSMLLGSLGSTNYTISKICVWADTPAQLENIIFIEDIDANGNVGSTPLIPYLDSNQLQNQSCFDLSGYILNVNSKIKYQIQGNTTLRLSFTVDTNKNLSVPNQIQDLTGINEIENIRAQIGQNEPEEKSGWDKIVSPSTGKEPGEKKPQINNLLSNQEQLVQELTQEWPSSKLDDLYAPKSDPIYSDKQQGMDKLKEADKVIEKTIPDKIIKTTKFNSNIIWIIIGSAAILWILSGKSNLAKEIIKK